MTLGTIKNSGTATLAAGSPGVKGSIAVAYTSLLATDRVIVTISGVTTQTSTDVYTRDLTFEVVKVAGTGFTIYSNLKQNKSVTLDYVVVADFDTETKTADEDIEGDYVSFLILDGTSAAVGITKLGISEIGQRVQIFCSDSTNAVTVTCVAGTTFNGTHTIATFDAASDFIELFAVSATEFVVISNTSVVLS